ncbi:MAG: ABC transporter permease [Bacteroidota bacterium]
MNGSLIATIQLDIAELVRARWFLLYSLVFSAVVIALLGGGGADSRLLGFTGLSRSMVAYIQLAMAILPVFVLVSTVRSLVGDREAGVVEFMLSLPVPLAAWYWGRLAARFLAATLPVVLAVGAAALYGLARFGAVPWGIMLAGIGLLVALTWCFLGVAFLISSLCRSADVALGVALVTWLVLLVFMDLVLLGVMVREQVATEVAVFVALANPLQVFRTAAMLIFDPQLVLLGTSAWMILDVFGTAGYLLWAVVYPVILGTVAAAAGYWTFRRGDLV